MITSLHNSHNTLSYRILSGFVAFSFLFSLVLPPNVSAQVVLNLPAPGTMVSLSAGFTPALINGITIHPENPLEFDFIIGTGDQKLQGKAFEEESTKLIKYFLASLTVPEDQMWVNLSPYEKDRIIPNGFGTTEMGRDLLAQDYILKQLTASLMYPEKELGSEFWKKIYQKAYEQYGTTEIPVDTFNKVWIVPEKAIVYEHGNSAFVVKSHLKVMLEEDYEALRSNAESRADFGSDRAARDEAQVQSLVSGNQRKETRDDFNSPAVTQVIREVLIPAIEVEVNEGKTFANLRQIYNSVILAAWFKKNLRETLLGQVYVDKTKTKGVDVEDKEINQKIYNQYLEAFKKGVYNYIKEDTDPITQEMIPRKYFSGGTNLKVSDLVQTYKDKQPLTRAQQEIVGEYLAGLKEYNHGRVRVALAELSPETSVADAQKAIAQAKQQSYSPVALSKKKVENIVDSLKPKTTGIMSKWFKGYDGNAPSFLIGGGRIAASIALMCSLGGCVVPGTMGKWGHGDPNILLNHGLFEVTQAFGFSSLPIAGKRVNVLDLNLNNVEVFRDPTNQKINFINNAEGEEGFQGRAFILIRFEEGIELSKIKALKLNGKFSNLRKIGIQLLYKQTVKYRPEQGKEFIEIPRFSGVNIIDSLADPIPLDKFDVSHPWDVYESEEIRKKKSLTGLLIDIGNTTTDEYDMRFFLWAPLLFFSFETHLDNTHFIELNNPKGASLELDLNNGIEFISQSDQSENNNVIEQRATVNLKDGFNLSDEVLAKLSVRIGPEEKVSASSPILSSRYSSNQRLVMFSDLTGTLVKKGNVPGALVVEMTRRLRAGAVLVIVTGDSMSSTYEQFVKLLPVDVHNRIIILPQTGMEGYRFKEGRFKKFTVNKDLFTQEQWRNWDQFRRQWFDVYQELAQVFYDSRWQEETFDPNDTANVFYDYFSEPGGQPVGRIRILGGLQQSLIGNAEMNILGQGADIEGLNRRLERYLVEKGLPFEPVVAGQSRRDLIYETLTKVIPLSGFEQLGFGNISLQKAGGSGESINSMPFAGIDKGWAIKRFLAHHAGIIEELIGGEIKGENVLGLGDSFGPEENDESMAVVLKELFADKAEVINVGGKKEGMPENVISPEGRLGPEGLVEALQPASSPVEELREFGGYHDFRRIFGDMFKYGELKRGWFIHFDIDKMTGFEREHESGSEVIGSVDKIIVQELMPSRGSFFGSRKTLDPRFGDSGHPKGWVNNLYKEEGFIYFEKDFPQHELDLKLDKVLARIRQETPVRISLGALNYSQIRNVFSPTTPADEFLDKLELTLLGLVETAKTKGGDQIVFYGNEQETPASSPVAYEALTPYPKSHVEINAVKLFSNEFARVDSNRVSTIQQEHMNYLNEEQYIAQAVANLLKINPQISTKPFPDKKTTAIKLIAWKLAAERDLSNHSAGWIEDYLRNGRSLEWILDRIKQQEAVIGPKWKNKTEQEIDGEIEAILKEADRRLQYSGFLKGEAIEGAVDQATTGATSSPLTAQEIKRLEEQLEAARKKLVKATADVTIAESAEDATPEKIASAKQEAVLADNKVKRLEKEFRGLVLFESVAGTLAQTLELNQETIIPATPIRDLVTLLPTYDELIIMPIEKELGVEIPSVEAQKLFDRHATLGELVEFVADRVGEKVGTVVSSSPVSVAVQRAKSKYDLAGNELQRVISEIPKTALDNLKQSDPDQYGWLMEGIVFLLEDLRQSNPGIENVGSWQKFMMENILPHSIQILVKIREVLALNWSSTIDGELKVAERQISEFVDAAHYFLNVLTGEYARFHMEPDEEYPLDLGFQINGQEYRFLYKEQPGQIIVRDAQGADLLREPYEQRSFVSQAIFALYVVLGHIVTRGYTRDNIILSLERTMKLVREDGEIFTERDSRRWFDEQYLERMFVDNQNRGRESASSPVAGSTDFYRFVDAQLKTKELREKYSALILDSVALLAASWSNQKLSSWDDFRYTSNLLEDTLARMEGALSSEKQEDIFTRAAKVSGGEALMPEHHENVKSWLGLLSRSSRQQEIGLTQLKEIQQLYAELAERYYSLKAAAGPASSPMEAISQGVINKLEEVYAQAGADRNDENLKPIVARDAAGNPVGMVEDGDVIFYINHRADRALPSLEAFTNPDFNAGGKRFDTKPVNVTFIPFSNYDPKTFKARGIKAAFEADVTDYPTVSDRMQEAGVIQGRFAESNKGKHVTYFWDGRRIISDEEYERGNIHVQITTSEEVPDETKKPEMKYAEVARETVQFLEDSKNSGRPVFALVNFATDIQGHVLNGDKERAIKTVLATDKALGEIRQKVEELGGVLIGSADHGNLEEMVMLDENGIPARDEFGVIPSTQHSFDNPVPFIIEGLGNALRLKEGRGLVNVGPTILDIMGISSEGMEESLLEGYQRKPIRGPVVFVLRDGWGLNRFDTPEAREWDAVQLAQPPVDRDLMAQNPWTKLKAHGDAVGLPENQMGDSDNGHTTMGAGIKVPTVYGKIMGQIQSGEFYNNEVLRGGIQKAMDEGHDIVISGLLSAGGVHSHSDYVLALLELSARLGVHNTTTKIKIHADLDGRDVITRVPDQNGAYYLRQILKKAKELGLENNVVIGSVGGRAFGMDRDGINGEAKGGNPEVTKRIWNQRFKRAYDARVDGIGIPAQIASSPVMEEYTLKSKRAIQLTSLAFPDRLEDLAGVMAWWVRPDFSESVVPKNFEEYFEFQGDTLKDIPFGLFIEKEKAYHLRTPQGHVAWGRLREGRHPDERGDIFFRIYGTDNPTTIKKLTEIVLTLFIWGNKEFSKERKRPIGEEIKITEEAIPILSEFLGRKFTSADEIERYIAEKYPNPKSLGKAISSLASSPVTSDPSTSLRASERRATSDDVGGINLNPELLDLQIKRDGNGVPLPLPQQPIGTMHIEGFLPIIINVTPVTNLPLLLGVADEEKPTDSADAQPMPMELGLAVKEN